MTLEDCRLYDVVRLPNGFVGYVASIALFDGIVQVVNDDTTRNSAMELPVERLQSALDVAMAKVRQVREQAS